MALLATGLAAHRLCLELTESTFLEDGDRSRSKMVAIREAGIGVALDDFGTGYSSLTYLADLPLDKLKIDQYFVRRMRQDSGVMEIVKATIAMAHGMGLQVVAEGIESEAEAKALLDPGCQTGQGYLFGKPLAAEAMLASCLHLFPREDGCRNSARTADSIT